MRFLQAMSTMRARSLVTPDDGEQPHAFVSSTVSGATIGCAARRSYSNAVAISNSGAIAGGSKLDSEHGYRAVIWIPGSAVADLGTPAGMYSNATAISDADWIIGTWGQGTTTRPFLWRPGSGMADLALLVDLSGTDFNKREQSFGHQCARRHSRHRARRATGDPTRSSSRLCRNLARRYSSPAGFLLLIGWRTRIVRWRHSSVSRPASSRMHEGESAMTAIASLWAWSWQWCILAACRAASLRSQNRPGRRVLCDQTEQLRSDPRQAARHARRMVTRDGISLRYQRRSASTSGFTAVDLNDKGEVIGTTPDYAGCPGHGLRTGLRLRFRSAAARCDQRQGSRCAMGLRPASSH